MQFYSILKISPFGIYKLETVSETYIQNLINNGNIINTFIGPLLNGNDIELGATYNIYCNISTNKKENNIILTNLLSKEIDNYFVNGYGFIIKKYEHNYTNINEDEISDIFNILYNATAFKLKIMSYNSIGVKKNNDFWLENTILLKSLYSYLPH